MRCNRIECIFSTCICIFTVSPAACLYTVRVFVAKPVYIHCAGWWNACVSMPIVKCMAIEQRRNRSWFNKQIAHVLSLFFGRNIDALRSCTCNTKRTGRVAGEGIYALTLIPFAVWLCTEYRLFSCFFIRFWRFSLPFPPFLSFCFVVYFFFIPAFLVAFNVFRNVYAGAPMDFSTIKGPAGFELTIILTSNLLRSQSNSFVGIERVLVRKSQSIQISIFQRVSKYSESTHWTR